MDVYLAARFGRREELRAIAHELRERGIAVTSRWIDVELDDRAVDPKAREAAADQNLFDIHRAQVLVALSEDPEEPVAGGRRGGRHVELGIAIAQRKTVVVVGPPENVFHYLDRVRRFDLVGEAIEFLTALAAERR